MSSPDASMLAAYQAAREVGVQKHDVDALLVAIKEDRPGSFWPEGFM